MLFNKNLIFIFFAINLLFISCESDDKLTLCDEGYISLNSKDDCYSSQDSAIIDSIAQDNELDFEDLSEFGYQEWIDGHLVILDLSNENLTSISSELLSFQALQNLNLGFNQLSQIPISLSQIPTLQYLSLYSNNFIEFPSFLANSENLVSLYMSYNSLNTVSLANAELLGYLYLDNNNLDELIIENLPTLHTLDLHNNLFSEIPNSIISPNGLNSLISVNLKSNQIISFDGNALCELNDGFIINLYENNICSDNDLGTMSEVNCNNLGGIAIDCITNFFGSSCSCFEDLNNNGQFDNYDNFNIVDNIMYCSNGKEITLYLDSCD